MALLCSSVLKAGVLKAGTVLLVLAASGCSHLLKVESKPIVIELHVKIDQDVRVQVDGDVPAVLMTGQAIGQTTGGKKAQPADEKKVSPDTDTPP